jgi:acyl-ACP thioesterase
MIPVVPSPPPATELLDEPSDGRVFSAAGRVRLGDVDRQGRMRLDAIARALQDVATDDASDAGLDRRFGWLVRRTMIESTTPVRLGEPFRISTWCTGIGRSWAERRTSIVGDRGGRIDGVSLWVQIDAETGRPTRIASDFVDAYGSTAGGRTVSARLGLPPPAHDAADDDWHVRRTDLDPFGHVNNAATWCFLEEAARLDESDRCGRAELEYIGPIEPNNGPFRLLRTSTEVGVDAWLTAASGAVSAARWRALSE